MIFGRFLTVLMSGQISVTNFVRVTGTEWDIKAYEACLQCLEGETHDVLSEADFLREKLKVEEEERRLEEAIKETEKQCAEVNTELKELDLKSKSFDELEE
ncbi:hypothetical protein IFM89_023282, partial [Coptis chinensis]